MPDKCPRPLLKEGKKLLSAIEECLREGGERDRGLDGCRVRLLWVTVIGLMSGDAVASYTCVHKSVHHGWRRQNFSSVDLTDCPKAASWPALGQSQEEGRGPSLPSLSPGPSSLSKAPPRKMPTFGCGSGDVLPHYVFLPLSAWALTRRWASPELF